MHKNSRFNIVQAQGNCNPNFVVIDGERTDSGHMASGSKVVSKELPRDTAIKLADQLQAIADADAQIVAERGNLLTKVEQQIVDLALADMKWRGDRFGLSIVFDAKSVSLEAAFIRYLLACRYDS